MAKKEKKELTPQQKKVQTAMNWVLNILCIIIIVFAFVLSVVTISQTTNDDNLPHFGKKYYMAVRTDSMEPTFNAGDMIVGIKYDGTTKLEVGQVITFRVIRGNTSYVNTHRIVEVNTSGSNVYYVTKGDHEAQNDFGQVATSNIIATWGTKDSNGKVLKGLGKINNWLYDEEHLTGSGKSIRYFLVIVLPLILLFVAYAFVLIYSLVKNKLTKAQQVAVNDLSDEEKAKLAQEYLASQGITVPTEEKPAEVDVVEEEVFEDTSKETTEESDEE